MVEFLSVKCPECGNTFGVYRYVDIAAMGIGGDGDDPFGIGHPIAHPEKEEERS